MANISEKAISILAGNLNLGPSYLITTVILPIDKAVIPITADSLCSSSAAAQSSSSTSISRLSFFHSISIGSSRILSNDRQTPVPCTLISLINVLPTLTKKFHPPLLLIP